MEKDTGKKKKSIKKRIIKFFIPLYILIILLAGVVLFRNIIAKTLIRSSMQAGFGAKCDIESVKINLKKSSFTVYNLYQADKNNPMSNLFEVSLVDVDIDFGLLLKGKVVIDNLECNTLLLNTPRTVSGALPEKKKKQKKDEGENKFALFVKDKAASSYNSAKESLEGTLSAFNPQSILENAGNALKSPAVAQESAAKIDVLVQKWKDVPDKYERQVTDLQKDVKKYTDLDINSVKKNPAQIPDLIKQIKDTAEKAKKLKSDIQTIARDVKTDAKTVEAVSRNVKAAIEADTVEARSQINKIKALNVNDGKKLLSDCIDNIGYQLLGKYYPYLQKICAKLGEQKTSSGKKKTVKKQKTDKAPDVPSFVLKRALLSGEGFNTVLSDVSNNMDLWGKPAVAETKLIKNGVSHIGLITFDTRSDTAEPLIKMNYSGTGYRINAEASDYIDVKGVPSLSSIANVKGVITADEKAFFAMDMNADFTDAVFKVASFSPDTLHDIYEGCYKDINSFDMHIKSSFNEDGLSLNVDTALENKIKTAVYKTLNEELNSIKNNALKQVQAELNSKSSMVFEKMDDFEGVAKKLNVSVSSVEKLESELNDKVNQLQKTLQNAAKDSVSDALKNNVPGNLKKLF